MDENLSGAFDEEQYKEEEMTKEDMDFYRQERTAMSDEEFFKWIDSIEGNKNVGA